VEGETLKISGMGIVGPWAWKFGPTNKKCLLAWPLASFHIDREKKERREREESKSMSAMTSGLLKTEVLRAGKSFFFWL
jgi:hypothetical protein